MGGWKFFGRYLGTTLAIALAIMGASSLGLYLAGSRNPHSYGNLFVSIGGAIWGLGALSVLGEWKWSRSFISQYGGSVSGAGLGERVKRQMSDLLSAYGFLIRCGLVGAILFGVGTWLYSC